MRKALLICLTLLFAMGMAFAQKNVAVTYQEGVGNVAQDYQMGKENYSWQQQLGDNNGVHRVEQWGESNQAYQDIGVGWAENNSGLIHQEGKSNVATQKQRWDYNYAEARQNGEENTTYQEQLSRPDQNNPGHTAYAEQWGYRNSIIQLQDKPAVLSPGNNAYAYQEGTFNQAYSKQYGFGNNVEQYVYSPFFPPFSSDGNIQNVDQTGDYNFARQTVGWGDDNEGYTTQLGNVNRAYMYQEGWSNLAVQTQTGDNNFAAADQYGRDHESYQIQDGSGHQAYSFQEGVGHINTQTQKGAGNISHNSQHGM
jgi:hypothetical protein